MEYSELKKKHFGTNDTDKKLTDEEIISSLEVIATTRNCNECKIRNCKWGTCNCSQITANAALDLINRQKAEIEKLEKENTVFGEIIKKQDDEISALRKDLLKRENLEESFSKSVKQFDKRLEKTVKLERAEAVKEFAEKLKNEINIRTTYSREQDKNVMRMIDNLIFGNLKDGESGAELSPEELLKLELMMKGLSDENPLKQLTGGAGGV